MALTENQQWHSFWWAARLLYPGHKWTKRQDAT